MGSLRLTHYGWVWCQHIKWKLQERTLIGKATCHWGVIVLKALGGERHKCLHESRSGSGLRASTSLSTLCEAAFSTCCMKEGICTHHFCRLNSFLSLCLKFKSTNQNQVLSLQKHNLRAEQIWVLVFKWMKIVANNKIDISNVTDTNG